MMKRWLSALAALLLAVSMSAAAEYDWSATYDAYYVTYDAATVKEYQCVAYAESDGVLLYMHDDMTEVNVSTVLRSDAAGIDDLAALQLKYVAEYGQVIGEPQQQDWYAPWDGTQPGCRLSYRFTYGVTGDDTMYDVVKYMAVLNDDKYVMVEVLDCSGDMQRVTQALESGFLPGLGVASFPVSGGGSAYLIGADEREGDVFLTLQPYEVVLDEATLRYEVKVSGEPQVLRLHADARIMAPVDENTGMLADVECTEKAIRSFIDGYRTFNGEDCVFNILLSGGQVRWMTYSYIY